MKRDQGFSLIEVLISVSILSIIVVALSGSLIAGMQARRTSLDAGAANRYAESVLERYKALWQNDDAYSNKLVPSTLPAAPTGFEQTTASTRPTIESLNVDGSKRTTDIFSDPAPIRRLTMTVRKNGVVKATVITEIGKPLDQR